MVCFSHFIHKQNASELAKPEAVIVHSKLSRVCVTVCACAIPPQVMTCPVSSSAECAVDADHTQTVLTGMV